MTARGCADGVVAWTAPDAEATRTLGARLGRLLGRGDLVILTGALGAGKTTLVQGIGAGLGVRGPVTSPTFVIARVHPSLGEGPSLVHADAYRLGGVAELDDLDLDTAVEETVTVVEWGEGLAEDLAADRLEVELTVDPAGDPADEPPADGPRADVSADDLAQTRRIRVRPVGRRWRQVDLGGALTALG